MNPEIGRRWVQALRSGDYAQGQERLARTMDGVTKYCCLGVLCEIAVEDGIVMRFKQYGSVTDTYYVSNASASDRSCTSLPVAVMEWAGMSWGGDPTRYDPISTHEEVTVDEEGDIHKATLVDLNDSYGYSFDQIADVIERDLMKVEKTA